MVNGFPQDPDPALLNNRDEYEPGKLMENLILGTPDEAIAKLKRYEALGVDYFCYMGSYGLPIPAQRKSLKLFINEVMPEFQECAQRGGLTRAASPTTADHMALGFGIGLGQDQDVHNVARYAKAAEDLGYHHVTMIDMGTLSQEVHVLMTVAAQGTERIRIGHGVTNPATYHPGAIANATASLRELTGDRAFVGIGAGGPLRPVPQEGRADARAPPGDPVHQGLLGRPRG